MCRGNVDAQRIGEMWGCGVGELPMGQVVDVWGKMSVQVGKCVWGNVGVGLREIAQVENSVTLVNC